MFRSTPPAGEGIPGQQSHDEKWDQIKMNSNLNPTHQIKNEDGKNKKKNKKGLSSNEDDETQYPGTSGERREDPYESCTGSGDGDSSKKEKLKMLPRVVVEETLLDTKVVVRKTPAGPRSWKEQKAISTFANVKANATSPPPTIGREVTTEEEERQGSHTRPSSLMGSATDIANLDDLSSNAESEASMRTTASGAQKRKKTMKDDNPKKTRNKGERQDHSPSTEEEDNRLETKEKRKRGRPATTGEGIEIRKRREIEKEIRELQEEKRKLEKILEWGYDPSEYKGGRQSKRSEEMEEEIKNLPSRDIAAQMMKAAKQVEEVAAKSGNLKGGFVKILKEAVVKMTLGMDALIYRSLPNEDENANAREMERLREEIRNLREEMERLRARKDQELMPPPRPQQITESEYSPVDRMEVGEEGRENTPPRPRPTHPPKEKWPAIRPAIQGVTKILKDEEDILTSTLIPVSTPRERAPSEVNLKIIEMDVRKILNEKFQQLSSQISAQIKEEVGRFLPTLVGGTSPLSPSGRVPDRARINAPNTSAPERDAEERPVPARKGKAGREKKDKGVKSTTPKGVTSSSEDGSKTATTPSKERSQPVPPTETKKGTEESWVKIVGRKAKDKTNNKQDKKVAEKETTKEVTRRKNEVPTKAPNSVAATKEKAGSRKPRRRVPRTAAVVLTCPPGQYAETMTEIKAKIKLSEVGIQDGITTRTAATGALLIEVTGSENGPKADALASRIREVLKDKKGVRVNRPTKMAELRVKGLECSISKEEVINAVAEKGACHPYEIKTGEIRRTSENQGSLWLKLPLAAAKKAAEKGTIQVGWNKVKVALLEERPLRCYKCLERGHVKTKCPSLQDRSDRCYRCGGLEHNAKECAAPPKCPICTDLGRKADHALGGQQCTTQRRRGRTEEIQGQKTNPSPTVEKPSTQTASDKEKEEMPKPQRLPRNRAEKSQEALSTPVHAEEEAMETEPLEEGQVEIE